MKIEIKITGVGVENWESIRTPVCIVHLQAWPL